MKKEALDPPQDKRGYKRPEIMKIYRDRGIKSHDFWRAFGVATCEMDENGETYFNKCDVESALFKLGQVGGKNHAWD